MKQNNEQELAPKLRFPEFRNGPGWEKTTLGKIADFYKGKGISKAEIDQEGKLQCIRYGELYTHYGEVITDVRSRTNVQASELLLSRTNDVIIPASGETKLDIAKASCVLRDGVALGGDLNVIRTVHDGRFLSYYLNGPKRLDIAKLAQGDTVAHLYPSQLGKLTLAIPKLGEQQKIADCLFALDEAIGVKARKIVALQAHKKGLMQLLFPAQGKTFPRLRFPEFRDAPAWEEERIGDVAPLQRGFDLPLSAIEPGHVPVVYSNGVRSFHKVGMAKGPGLVTGRSGTIGTLHFIEEGDYWPHNTSLWVTTFKGNDPKFVYYLYASIGLGRFASGSGVPTLNRNDVHAFVTRVPSAHSEQRQIAECLTSLDALIAAESSKLSALRTHKRGLMQELFPSPAAVDA